MGGRTHTPSRPQPRGLEPHWLQRGQLQDPPPTDSPPPPHPGAPLLLLQRVSVQASSRTQGTAKDKPRPSPAADCRPRGPRGLKPQPSSTPAPPPSGSTTEERQEGRKRGAGLALPSPDSQLPLLRRSRGRPALSWPERRKKQCVRIAQGESKLPLHCTFLSTFPRPPPPSHNLGEENACPPPPPLASQGNLGISDQHPILELGIQVGSQHKVGSADNG